MIAVIQLISWNINTIFIQKVMHYRSERNLTAMLSHPAYLFLQARRFVQSSFKSLFGRHLLEICLQDLEMANLKEQQLDSLCKDWQVYFCSQAFL